MRMSDLVRGIQRRADEPPAQEAPPTDQPSEVPSADASASAPDLPSPSEPAPPSPSEPEPEETVTERPTEVVRGEPPDELYADVSTFTRRLPALAREGQAFPWDEYEQLLERVIAALEDSADLFWLANDPPAGGESLPNHLTAVGILSVRIGVGLGYDRERLLSLGMAAFLFDVGVLRLPQGLLGKPEPLSGEDLAAYQTHVQLSADLVRRWAPSRPTVIEAILHHHERENGGGYPGGLAGGAIHPHAKIIGLMDAFTSLVFPRAGRRLTPYEAMREIVRSRQGEFASRLVKALLSEISVFPPRTVVRLNTGEVGRVIAVNRNHPLRPKIEIQTDAKGKRLLTPKILDLSETPFLYVTGPVHGGGG